MRNKTLALFVFGALAVSIALGAVTGVFSSVKIGTHTVIPALTPGYTGTAATGYVVLSDSPALIGVPTAPTAAPGTNTTQIATTAFVQNTFTTSLPIVARWSGNSCTLVDNGGGGSYCDATTVSWGTTISGTYYWWCTAGILPLSPSDGKRGQIAVNNVSQTSTDFTYFLDSPYADGRTLQVPMTCWATN